MWILLGKWEATEEAVGKDHTPYGWWSCPRVPISFNRKKKNLPRADSFMNSVSISAAGQVSICGNVRQCTVLRYGSVYQFGLGGEFGD